MPRQLNKTSTYSTPVTKVVPIPISEIISFIYSQSAGRRIWHRQDYLLCQSTMVSSNSCGLLLEKFKLGSASWLQYVTITYAAAILRT